MDKNNTCKICYLAVNGCLAHDKRNSFSLANQDYHSINPSRPNSGRRKKKIHLRRKTIWGTTKKCENENLSWLFF